MRPRERYLREGPRGLDDGDLMQLILGSGGVGRPVERIAHTLLTQFGGLSGLLAAEPQELLGIGGLGPAQAARVHAAMVLGSRCMVRADDGLVQVHGRVDAERLLAPRLRGLGEEELHALFLDVRHRVVGWRALTRGSMAFTVVDPRQVFRVAIRLGAAAVILAHNHPSGDATPSTQDLDVTRRVDHAGRVLGIRLLDHLVVGATEVVSLAAQGLLSEWDPGPVTTR